MEIPEYEITNSEKHIAYYRGICEKDGRIEIDHDSKKIFIKDFDLLHLAATGIKENANYEVYLLNAQYLGDIENRGTEVKGGRRFQRGFNFSPVSPLESINLTIDLKE